jgi:hypothetical protein
LRGAQSPTKDKGKKPQSDSSAPDPSAKKQGTKATKKPVGVQAEEKKGKRQKETSAEKQPTRQSKRGWKSPTLGQ